MRNLIITREKSFVGSISILKVYIEDSVNPEITINNTPCRKLGTLKNGEQKSFPVEDTAARVYVIADKFSKNFCNEFFDVPAGSFDVAIKGKNHYNPLAGNPFRFEGVDNEEVLAHRKKIRRKSYIIMAILLPICFAIGWGIGYFGISQAEKIVPQTFSREGMSITLTSDFMYVPQENFTACYGNEDYSVLAIKEEFSLFSEKITLDEYADLVLAEMPDVELTEYEGLQCFEYAAEGGGGVEYCYFATVFETEDAFWLIQFATETEKYEEIFPDFVQWAKTITFE